MQQMKTKRTRRESAAAALREAAENRSAIQAAAAEASSRVGSAARLRDSAPAAAPTAAAPAHRADLATCLSAMRMLKTRKKQNQQRLQSSSC